MSKRRVSIDDEHGNHIGTFYFPEGSVDFEDGQLDGLCATCTSVLRGRSFARSGLYWAMLQDSDLRGCNFEDACLQGANLMGANLQEANLRRADLTNDNLGGATRLQGADLTGAILNRCKLTGALYDEDTVFPRGFDPDAAGMIAVS